MATAGGSGWLQGSAGKPAGARWMDPAEGSPSRAKLMALVPRAVPPYASLRPPLPCRPEGCTTFGAARGQNHPPLSPACTGNGRFRPVGLPGLRLRHLHETALSSLLAGTPGSHEAGPWAAGLEAHVAHFSGGHRAWLVLPGAWRQGAARRPDGGVGGTEFHCPSPVCPSVRLGVPAWPAGRSP